MSFYNTGNPVPSIDPRDLDDNAKHIDEIVNSTFTTFIDRLGVPRKTLAGLEADVAPAITLRDDLADPNMGSNLVAFDRESTIDTNGSVSHFLSAQWVNIREFDSLAVGYPSGDPSTWNWTPAVQHAVDNYQNMVIYMPPTIKYRFGSSVRVPINSATWTILRGDPEATTIILDPGVPTAFRFATSPPSGAIIQRINISGFVVDASQTTGTDGAVIFGGRQGGVESKHLSYDQIHLSDLRAFGMSSDTSGGNFRIGIQMSSIFDSIADPATTMTRIYIDRVRLEGGITGIYMGAGVPSSNNAPLWMDEIYITDFWHDTMISNALFPAAGIQVGQDGQGGKIRVTRAYCANGGDVGIELNAFYDFHVKDSVLYRPGTGFWSFNYQQLSDPKKQIGIWENCKVIRPENNPGWRIGQTAGGHLSLINCSMEIDELSDSRVLDFASGTLENLESLTIRDFKLYVKTATNAAYTSLAGALSLQLNVPDWQLTVDGFTVNYEGVVPKAAHDCSAIIFNSSTVGALVHTDIKGLRVSDKRTGTLVASDAIRIYGTVKAIGSIDNMIIDSTVSVSQARHGIYVAASSVPAPELKVSNSDISGCSSNFELTTINAGQRPNVLWENVKFNKTFDDTTGTSNPTVTTGDYFYTNNTGQPVRAIVTGGTVSALAISQNGGTNYFSLGAIAGTFVVMPNEKLRISNTVIPQLRIIVLTRITG